jgi:hypothetical protein
LKRRGNDPNNQCRWKSAWCIGILITDQQPGAMPV